MRLLAFIEYSAIVAGAMGVVAGRSFGLPDALHLGVFLVGAGLALGGIESIVMGRMGFRFSDGAAQRWAGLPAIVFGVMVLVSALLVIGAAYLLANASWSSTLAQLRLRPGPVYVVAGFLTGCAGLLFALDAVRRPGLWWWRLLLGVPETIVGAGLILAGALAMGAGAWEWSDPKSFARATKTAVELWESVAGPWWRKWRG